MAATDANAALNELIKYVVRVPFSRIISDSPQRPRYEQGP